MNHRNFRAKSQAQNAGKRTLANKFVKCDANGELRIALSEVDGDEMIELFIESCDKIKEKGYPIWKVIRAYENTITTDAFLVRDGKIRYLVDVASENDIRFYLAKITAHAVAYYRDLNDKRMEQALFAALYVLSFRYSFSFFSLFVDICEVLSEDGERHPFTFGSLSRLSEVADENRRIDPTEVVTELYKQYLMDFIENAEPEDMELLLQNEAKPWSKLICVKLLNPVEREEIFLDAYTKIIPKVFTKLVSICARVAFRQYFQDGYEHDIVERDYWERIVPAEYGIHDTVTAPSSVLYLLSKFADMLVESRDIGLKLVLVDHHLWADIIDTVVEDCCIEPTEINEVLRILEEQIGVAKDELDDYISLRVFDALEAFVRENDTNSLTILMRLLVNKKAYELISHVLPELVDTFARSRDELFVKMMPAASDDIKSHIIERLIQSDENANE